MTQNEEIQEVQAYGEEVSHKGIVDLQKAAKIQNVLVTTGLGIWVTMGIVLGYMEFTSPTFQEWLLLQLR